MPKHGFNVKEKQFIKEHAPHEPVKFIADTLGVSVQKVDDYLNLIKLNKLPLHERIYSIEYECYKNNISLDEYYEIEERAAHEPLAFIARDMNLEQQAVYNVGIKIDKFPMNERVYTKQYSMFLFKITNEEYDEITELGLNYSIKTIQEITKKTLNCITKVLYSCGINERTDKVVTIPQRCIDDIPDNDVLKIIKYYPHFTNVRLINEYGLKKDDIKIVVKFYGLTKNTTNKKLCIICRKNTRVGTKQYGSYCRRCFTDMMIEYQKEYYPKNKHRIPCRVDEVTMFENIERNK